MFLRSANNPILRANRGHDWEAFKVYNPGVIFAEGKYHLFYRAMNHSRDWRSSIGYAVSEDGENFERFEQPLLVAESPAEKRGLEDPRITKVDQTYYMAYASFDGLDVRLNIATSSDLKNWQKRGQALSDFEFLKNGGHKITCHDGEIVNQDDEQLDKEWSKSGAIFPQKINNKYWLLFGEYNGWLANSDDGLQWQVLPDTFLNPRSGQGFDSAFVEVGPPPIKTELGWLVLYHGIDQWHTYRLSFMLLDLNDPTKIIYRHNDFIFEPLADYELHSSLVDIATGGVASEQELSGEELRKHSNESVDQRKKITVVFCCGAVVIDDKLRIYYGAGDEYICTAVAKLSDILVLVK